MIFHYCRVCFDVRLFDWSFKMHSLTVNINAYLVMSETSKGAYTCLAHAQFCTKPHAGKGGAGGCVLVILNRSSSLASNQVQLWHMCI